MYNHKRSIKNFLGLVIKLGALPLALTFAGDFLPDLEFHGWSVMLSLFLILGGLVGVLVSDILLLRFGDGNVHLSKRSNRLVDVGYYARTRHPFFWFISIYQLGILVFHLGFTALSLMIWVILTLAGLAYLLLVQEKQLLQSFGEKYAEYQQNTPLLYWKFKILPNQSVKILPQLVWLFGMLFLRNWYKIQVQGIKHIPHEKPFILVANHESYLDPFLFGIFVPFEIKFVTTADVFTTPLMRFLLRGSGTFPMRRHRQDLKAIRTMIRTINSGQVVGIFPEGGRSIDGTPLPILTETLKLIQHCKVPILPVQLDGAYEIWPRWSAKRRRGRCSVSFKPVIPVDEQSDLTGLNERIQAAIFAPVKQYRPVKSRVIAHGLENFLWACPECKTRNSIELVSGNSIKCGHCAAQWTMTNDYTLVNQQTSTSLMLHEWISHIGDHALNQTVVPEFDLDLHQNEQVYLFTSIDQYRSEEGQELTDALFLSMTNQRIILSQKGEILHSWLLELITIFTMDYYNAVSIGVGGIRYTFYLPIGEISLKWQTYYEKLVSS